MKNIGQFISRTCFGILLLLNTGSWSQPAETNQVPTGLQVASNVQRALQKRAPAVAGLFYPKDRKALETTIDGFLANAAPQKAGHVRALICPHAGYEYSGPTAAFAYKLISGGNYHTVIILAPSHYAAFRGASIPAAAAYETPLGTVPVSDKAQQIATASPFVIEPRCLVQRPPWSSLVSKSEAAPETDTPDTWEHSAEVQVPFLQRTLKDFKILPVIFGEVDPDQVAKALVPLLDDHTLVLASSDLSHYHPYEQARALDRQTLAWIEKLDIPALRSDRASESACGRVPILALLQLAKLKGWQPRLLDYRNSGDTAGDKGRVVGYGAVAFEELEGRKFSSTRAPEPDSEFKETEKKFLLDVARQALRRSASGLDLPEIPSNSVPATCRAARGCFVTLTRSGQLRGCIGNILPSGPLFRAVAENARNAALRDYRFRPVKAQEADELQIEISVLSPLQPLSFNSPADLLAKLQPQRDGVVLKVGNASATFLPQVWKQLPDKEVFLSHLSEKAGCPASAWRSDGVKVFIYHAEAFEETK